MLCLILLKRGHVVGVKFGEIHPLPPWLALCGGAWA